MSDNNLPSRSSSTEVADFLKRVAATPTADRGGRLLFALDATASREATWDRAMHLQAEMFAETSSLGGLAIQLCYYRGHREFRATRWLTDSEALLKTMTGVRCLGGITQIGRVLTKALAETKAQKVDAVVFVGDCVEESVDRLCDLAGQLGLRGTPLFLFHEGRDPRAERAFEQMAQLSGGACCPFDGNSPQQLKDLLSAVAVYAAGGHKALEDFSRRQQGATLALTHQLSRK